MGVNRSITAFDSGACPDQTPVRRSRGCVLAIRVLTGAAAMAVCLATVFCSVPVALATVPSEVLRIGVSAGGRSLFGASKMGWGIRTGADPRSWYARGFDVAFKDVTSPWTPDILGDEIAFCASGEFGDDDVFLFDTSSGLVTLVSDDAGEQFGVANCGDWVAWGTRGGSAITLRNLVSGQTITVDAKGPLPGPDDLYNEQPIALTEGWLVWTIQKDPTGIYAFNLTTRTTHVVWEGWDRNGPDQPLNATARGNWVVWDGVYSRYVEAYDLVGRKAYRVNQATSLTRVRHADVSSDGLLVWEDNRSGSADVWYKQLPSGTEAQIWSARTVKENPATNGTWVTWDDNGSLSREQGRYARNLKQSLPSATLDGDATIPLGASTNLVIGLVDGEQPLVGQDVVLQSSSDGQPWTDIRTFQTSEAGITWSVSPTTSTAYRVYFAGSPTLVPDYSAVAQVNVKITRSTGIKIAGPSSVRRWRTYRYTGTVSPSASPGTVLVVVTRLVGKRWKSVGSVRIPVVRGSYSFGITPNAKGKWRAVATYSGGSAGMTTYNPSKSGVKNLTVK